MQEKGFQGMTLQDVADELDFTKAALYYYVQDKQDVLFRIHMQTLEMMLESTEKIARSDASPPEKLRAFIDRQVHMVAEDTASFTVYFHEKAHLTPEHAEATTDKERQIVHTLTDIYRAGVAEGYFRDLDPTVATFALLGVSNWIYSWYRSEGRLSIDAVSQILQTITLSGLAQPR